MATISDIAKETGVSVGTVSNVINDKDNVRPATRKRVVSSIKKFGYRPNIIARSLRNKKTRIIGLILPDITYPFFTQLARTIENRFINFGYSILLCDSMNDLKKEKKYFEIMRERWVDGVIFSGVKSKEQDNRFIADFCLSDIPILMVDRKVNGFNKKVVSVTIDNFEASFKATEYLIKLNHKHIAYINHFPYIKIGAERFRGYENALKKHRIRRSSKLVKNFKNTDRLDYLEMGRSGAQRLLKQGNLFTAIMASNDIVAIGAMQELKHRGIKVPEDISIIGFDDIPLSSLIDCPLTTIKQPVNKIGEEAVNLLVRLIKKEKVEQKHLDFKTELTIRNSCIAIRTTEPNHSKRGKKLRENKTHEKSTNLSEPCAGKLTL